MPVTAPIITRLVGATGSCCSRPKSVSLIRNVLIRGAAAMYCCKCGARNPDDAVYCHNCGDAIYRNAAPSRPSDRRQVSRPTRVKQTEEQRQLAEELLRIDEKSHECHACGRTDDLHGWNFGLAKSVSEKRVWGATAASVAVSAVTLPFVGVGFLQLPGKKARLRVLRLRLILCGACRRQHVALGGGDGIDVAVYGLHPWWSTASRFGYTEFLNAADLSKLRPTK